MKMNLLLQLCLLCDLIFIPIFIITKANGHKINVIFINQGQEVDRWWFYEPLEPFNLSDPQRRFRRKPTIKAIHIGKEAECVKGKKQEQLNFAKVIPQYGTVHLPCRVCGQGDQEAMEAKTWFRWTKELEKGGENVVWKPEEVRLDVHDSEKFNRIYTKIDHTLVIKDFRPSDVGTYFCEKFSRKALRNQFSFRAPGKGGEEGAVDFALVYKRLVGKRDIDFLYHVDIESREEAVDSSTVSVNITQMKKPRKDVKNKEGNYIAYTDWGEWSPCSRCRQPGEKKRDGNCMIKKLDPDKQSQPEFLDSILDLYKAGAPCHSSLFHKHEVFRTLPKETQVEKCVIKCKVSKYDVFGKVTGANESQVMKDFQKRVRFDVNVSSQTGSMLSPELKNKLKGFMAPIKKTFQEGMKTKLICVAKKDNTLKWYKNDTLLLNSELAKNESYRVKISSKGHLKFAEVKRKDAGLYKCSFQKDKRKKEWIITVKKKIKPNWGHYYGMLMVSYVAMIPIFLILLCLRTSYLIHTKRKKFKKEKNKKKKGLFSKKNKGGDDEDDDEESDQ